MFLVWPTDVGGSPGSVGLVRPFAVARPRTFCHPGFSVPLDWLVEDAGRSTVIKEHSRLVCQSGGA